MRAIDNYTDKEREVLALKGMTAPRTASERPAPNKAQHSPLPWRLEIGEGACFHTGNRASIVRDFEDGGEQCTQTIAEVWPGDRDIDITDAKLIVASVNHADKLAEALREIIEPLGQDEIDDCWQYKEAQQALAAYEAAQ